MTEAQSEPFDITPLSFKTPADFKKLAAFYNKLRVLPFFWPDNRREDPYIFANTISAENARAFEIGKMDGIIYFTNIVQGDTAECHIALWGSNCRGKPEVARAVGTVMFKAFNLHKLIGCILAKNVPAIKYTEDLGFVQEGLLRQQVCYNGKREDLVVLGLLRDEARFSEEPDGRTKRTGRRGAVEPAEASVQRSIPSTSELSTG